MRSKGSSTPMTSFPCWIPQPTNGSLAAILLITELTARLPMPSGAIRRSSSRTGAGAIPAREPKRSGSTSKQMTRVILGSKAAARTASPPPSEQPRTVTSSSPK